MANPPVDKPQHIQLLRLGETDYGLLGASIEIQVDNNTGMATFFVAVHGGKLRQIEPHFKPIDVLFKPIGQAPVSELIKLFEARDKATEQPLLQLV